MFALTLFIGLNNNSANAQYKGHHETPTELRGTWYSWDKYNHKFYKMRITKYSAGPINNHNHKNHNYYYLYVSKASKGYGGINYDLNSKVSSGVAGASDGSATWLSHKKVHGKRVLMNYERMGYFSVMTRQRIKHDYSFTYNKNVWKRIGL
ncbi:hypothetical protein [Apilactobacillus micheneri]|uniref:hypothetical protein n=1 Tax=Apilactobacillus micheneri TaxID=1899430 RepID=UPI001125E4A2|nr:hypothetical protein [Apilactobacillus micheneri]TPR40451.1 hypothetical protein DY119_01805 [Apilactobacillus micheneri]